MTAAARRSYGQARVRARKASLFPPEWLVSAAIADRGGPLADWSELNTPDDAALLARIYGRLIDDYRIALYGYPAARPALLALLRLHELENVKLLWRCAVRHIPAAECRRLWRPLGALATVASDSCAAAQSLRELVAALKHTPYAEIAEAELRAHAEDPAAVEFALDRFGSIQLLDAADTLPADERLARHLIGLVVRSRDLLLIRRARESLGLTAEMAVRLAPGAQASGRREHARWLSEDDEVARHRLMAERQLACRRAFLGNPFSLAPPIALVLLREEESRRLLTLAELRARHASESAARRALEAAT